MTTSPLKDLDKAMYGAVKGFAHGNNCVPTMIGFEGGYLRNEQLRAAMLAFYPSAVFDIKHAGDTLTLNHEDGERFMAARALYRDQYGVTEGLTR